MRLNKIIAFAGRTQSGKNTAANIIHDLYQDASIIEFAFAGVLKDITQSSLRLDASEADYLKTTTTVKLINGMTLREYYNSLGDAIKKHFGIDAWVRLTLSEVDRSADKTDIAICTDLRYPIEEEGLREFAKDNDIDLVIIKMNNLNRPQRQDNEHESEYLIDSINEDYLINARTPIEIKEQLITILKGNA